jgi:hypothetical protein
VVAKVEWHPGELYPRVGFVVTNMTRPAERVVAFYNQRGTAEQWIREGKNALSWTRLSCHRFATNAVRLQLHALAYNLANFLRTLALPEAVKQWSLTTLAPAAGEDRRQDRPAWPLGDFPDGRSRGAACVVPDDPRRYCGSPAVTAGPMLRIAAPSSSRRACWRERRAQTRGCRSEEPPFGPVPHSKNGPNRLRSRNFLSQGLGEDYRLFRRRKIKGYLGNAGYNDYADGHDGPYRHGNTG